MPFFILLSFNALELNCHLDGSPVKAQSETTEMIPSYVPSIVATVLFRKEMVLVCGSKMCLSVSKASFFPLPTKILC